MEVAGACAQCQNKEEANARVHGAADDLKKERLAERADSGENIAYKVELAYLGRLRQDTSEAGNGGMQADIQPAADGIVGRVLPGLTSVAMGEVVCGLPVVVGLVAVLNGRKYSPEDVCCEK